MVHKVRRVNHDRAQRAHRVQRRVERRHDAGAQPVEEPPRDPQARAAQGIHVQRLCVVGHHRGLREGEVVARVGAGDDG